MAIGNYGQNLILSAPKVPPGSPSGQNNPKGVPILSDPIGCTMANIQKRERKTGTVYLADVRIHGFPRQKKTFKRLTDARLWAQQTEAAIRKGEFQNVVSTARSKTLNDVIQRYRDDVLPHKALSTQRAETTYLAFWERELGIYALSYIEPQLISAKLRELGEAGDGRRKADDGEAAKPAKIAPKSRKTLKHYRDTLALLLKHAKQWGWTAVNPIDGVNKITKIRNERMRFLSDEERTALLTACKASENEHLYPVVIFALSTGARKNEVLSLTFGDVDLKRGVAILRNTKNGDTRTVPIVTALQKLLGRTCGFQVPRHPPLDRQLSGDERRKPRGDCRGTRAQDASDGAPLRPPVGKSRQGAGAERQRQGAARRAVARSHFIVRQAIFGYM